MNLAGGISNVDVHLETLTEKLSRYFVTSEVTRVPDINEFFKLLLQDEYCSGLYSTVEQMYENLKEIRYFVHKTKLLEHKVLVCSFYLNDYYFIQKHDGSASMCLDTYLHEETAVQLRIFDYNFYTED